ncbi:hypothetical protein GCM10010112_75550 [Actinoplanes lobatus]|uniref:MFS family permease n=1 Tax=Actinoplanes lobatus TaxID=113568 RepID=A0A7W7HH81_9ACTN|nr:MFS transporter [Actinoplanes lobatus]MBB4750506.1 MFS family permease [Actinoplanes lobatus]GGN90288.1 hypothetical protein GCM10010112_75550 [Actinoplanes lobatus]GIE43817.1 hypothetical protein Alo02nite_67150 [Actinoplanes lobatus]
MTVVPGLRGWRLPAVLVALLISTVGDEIATVALALRGATATQTTVVVSAQFVASLLPGILFASWIGRLAERYRSDGLLAAALAGEAVIAVAASGADRSYLLIGATVLLGALGAIAQTCVMVLVPRLFPGPALVRANSILESTRNAGYVAGPLLAGGLVALGGTRLALLADAATFVIALAAMPLITASLAPPEPAPPESPAEDRPAGALRDGLSWLWRNGTPRITLSVVFVTIATTSVGNVMLPFFTQRFDREGAAYGVLLACWSVGLVIGPMLLMRLARTGRMAVLAVGSATTIGAAYLVTGLVPVLLALLVFNVIGGMANAMQNVSLRTAVMADCPDHKRGRVGAAYGATLQTAVATGFASAALFPADWARGVLLVGGAIAVLAGSIGLLLLSRRPADAPVAEPAEVAAE